MPSNSEISFRRAAVGLLSAAKKRSRWVNCSGVTRDLFRFSRCSPDFVLAAEDDDAVAERVVREEDAPAVAPMPGSVSRSSAFGDSGGGGASVVADKGTSPGVLGDMEPLGEEAVDDSVMRDISSA